MAKNGAKCGLKAQKVHCKEQIIEINVVCKSS